MSKLTNATPETNPGVDYRQKGKVSKSGIVERREKTH
jgi:hypothetical protein